MEVREAPGTGWRSWESKVKVQEDVVSSESRLPDFPTAVLSLCPHLEGGISSSSSKDAKPILGAPSSGPHQNLITSKRPPQLLIPSHWGSGLQQMNLERHTQPMTKPITIKLFFSLSHFSDFLYGSYDFHAVKTPISG